MVNQQPYISILDMNMNEQCWNEHEIESQPEPQSKIIAIGAAVVASYTTAASLTSSTSLRHHITQEATQRNGGT